MGRFSFPMMGAAASAREHGPPSVRSVTSSQDATSPRIVLAVQQEPLVSRSRLLCGLAATKSLRLVMEAPVIAVVALLVPLLIIRSSMCARGCVKVACVGDSITQGAGATPGHTYPEQLQSLLGSYYEVKGWGVSGTTATRNGTLCLDPAHDQQTDYRLFPEYSEALEQQADIVVIAFGTNDAKHCNWNAERFAADYRDLIAAFKAPVPSSSRPPPEVHLVVPPPLYGAGGMYGGMNKTVINSVLPGVVRDIAAESAPTAVVDIFSLFHERCPDFGPEFSRQDCSWTWDGCHPNNAGYLAMAEEARRVIWGLPAGSDSKPIVI